MKDKLKKLILAILYGVSLFMPASFQHRIVRVYARAFGQPWLLYRVAIRLKKQRLFVQSIGVCRELTGHEQRWFKGMAWRHLRLYERCWAEWKSIPLHVAEIDSNQLLLYKSKTLYDLRDTHALLKLGHETDTDLPLQKQQKQRLVRYAFQQTGPHHARELCEIFAKEGADAFFVEAMGKYRLMETVAQTWPAFLEKYGKQYDVENEASIEQCLQWLNQLPENEAELGIVLLIRAVENDRQTYLLVVKQLSELLEAGELHVDVAESAWNYMGLAEKAIQKQKFQLALHFVIRAYNTGERSEALYALLAQSLEQAMLRQEDMLVLERMMDDGFLSLTSEDAFRLLQKSDSFFHLYAHFRVDRHSSNAIGQLVEVGYHFDTEKRQSFYQYIIQALFQSQGPITLQKNELERLMRHARDHWRNHFVMARWYAQHAQMDEVEAYLSRLDDELRLKLLIHLAKFKYEQGDLPRALRFAEEAYAVRPKNIFVLRRLISIHHRRGDIRDRLRYIEEFQAVSTKFVGREHDMALDEVHLLDSFWEWQPDEAVQPIPVNEQQEHIVHVLNKSLPEVNGYTIRSKEIVENERELGFQPIVVTKLGWPPFRDKKEVTEHETIAGIDYYRLYDDQQPRLQLNQVPMSEYFQAYATKFAERMQRLKPNVIHAASNFQNALPALEVARKLGIYSVYEVRGMWHYSQSSKTIGFEHSDRYDLHQNYEKHCCDIADHVVAIGDSLRDHLIELGVPDSKISVVPNGVRVRHFQPKPPNPQVIAEYGLENKLVFGFIGSITEYEGLDLLIQAFARLKQVRSDIAMLIVGDGVALPGLQQLAQQLQLEKEVIFTGRVPHDAVQDYYSVIDVCPFPRTTAKVCELVTPLKPFEAMAMGKLVLVSDIPALREMVHDGQTGRIFAAENVDALQQVMEEVENDRYLAEAGREWVKQHRDWATLAKRYEHVYAQAVAVE